MGWKSIKEISREKAIVSIQERLSIMDNDDIETLLEQLGFGDDPDLKWHGYDFFIKD